MTRPLTLAPYDPGWPAAYTAEAAAITSALGLAEHGGVLYDLAHIGSTSVPGLVAKPCIDIVARIHPLPPPAHTLAALAALGYTYRGEHGVPGRHYLHRADEVHLHVVSFDTEHYAHHVLFRDLLRDHAPSRDRYAALKTSLAHLLPHARPAYTAAKAPLITELVALAETHHVARTAFAPIHALTAALADAPVPWAVASGWALDLALAAPSRHHDDLDLAVARHDAPDLLNHLAATAWTLHVVVAHGAYLPWTPTTPIPPDAHQVHARRAGVFLDILLEPRDPDLWRFRRHPSITRPLSLALQHAMGVPILAPELVLLFKAATRGAPPRPKDERDFARVAHTLAPEPRRWLIEALRTVSPGHGWIEALEG